MGFSNNPDRHKFYELGFPIIRTDEISSVRIYHNEAPIEPRFVLKNGINGSHKISGSPSADLQRIRDLADEWYLNSKLNCYCALVIPRTSKTMLKPLSRYNTLLFIDSTISYF